MPAEAVILQKENGAVRRCLLRKALQDGGLSATRKAADGDDAVKFELFGDFVLKLGTLDMEVIDLLRHDIQRFQRIGVEALDVIGEMRT